MASILITGSTDGVGRATAEALVHDGHTVVVHARTTARLSAVQHLIDRGAAAIVGDLADLDQVHGLLEQANPLGPLDAIVHNAGVMQGAVLPVNVTAPHLSPADAVAQQGRRDESLQARHATNPSAQDGPLAALTRAVVATALADHAGNRLHPDGGEGGLGEPGRSCNPWVRTLMRSGPMILEAR